MRPVFAVELARVLRRDRRAGDVVDVVDPAAALQRLERLLVVRLPESARVGRDREAADADLVPHDPRREHERGDAERERGLPRPAAAPPEDVRAEHERDEQRPHVPEDHQPEHAAEQRAPAQAAALRDDEREQHRGDREEVVQDLAVHVHVVPDEVRVQRRQQRRDEPDPPVDDAPADLVDEPRRRDRHRGVREPDHEPVAVEHPVERDQEEAVERLRVRRRDPRDEPVRPAVEERQREVVALVDERVRDVAAARPAARRGVALLPRPPGRDMPCADPSAH